MHRRPPVGGRTSPLSPQRSRPSRPVPTEQRRDVQRLAAGHRAARVRAVGRNDPGTRPRDALLVGRRAGVHVRRRASRPARPVAPARRPGACGRGRRRHRAARPLGEGGSAAVPPAAVWRWSPTAAISRSWSSRAPSAPPSTVPMRSCRRRTELIRSLHRGFQFGDVEVPGSGYCGSSSVSVSRSSWPIGPVAVRLVVARHDVPGRHRRSCTAAASAVNAVWYSPQYARSARSPRWNFQRLVGSSSRPSSRSRWVA